MSNHPSQDLDTAETTPRTAETGPASSLDSLRTTRRVYPLCPRAHGTLKRLGEHTYHCIPAPCKAWRCPTCGPAKGRKLAKRLSQFPAQRLLTLTHQPREGESIDAAFLRMSRSWEVLKKRIKRKYPESRFEYVRVWEATHRGWPHMHLLLRGHYLSQRWLSQSWLQIHGAPIVDIRKISNQRTIQNYLAKYLSKGGEMPDGLHRYQASQHTLPPTPKATNQDTPLDSKWSFLPVSVATFIRQAALLDYECHRIREGEWVILSAQLAAALHRQDASRNSNCQSAIQQFLTSVVCN